MCQCCASAATYFISKSIPLELPALWSKNDLNKSQMGKEKIWTSSKKEINRVQSG